jgi:branched-chain amino acid transport system permease protein
MDGNLIGLGCAVLAIPIGLIAMRTRADVFAIVTITLLFVAQTLGYNLKNLTGGAQGAGLSRAPFRLDIFEQPFYFAAVFLLLLAMGIAYFVTRTKLGMALTSIRADEDKARGVGVRTTAVKVMAFAISVGITGMAGGIWAYYLGFIYPQFAFDPLITIAIVLMTFLGGRATVWGPVLGAAILMPAQQLLAYYVGGSQIYLIAYASIFLLIMLLLPRGILPTVTGKRRLASLAKQGNMSGVSTTHAVNEGSNS